MDLDRGPRSISREAINCNAKAASKDLSREIRSPAGCALFEKPIDIHLNEHVQVSFAVRSPASICTHLLFTLNHQPLQTNVLVHPTHRAHQRTGGVSGTNGSPFPGLLPLRFILRVWDPLGFTNTGPGRIGVHSGRGHIRYLNLNSTFSDRLQATERIGGPSALPLGNIPPSPLPLLVTEDYGVLQVLFRHSWPKWIPSPARQSAVNNIFSTHYRNAAPELTRPHHYTVAALNRCDRPPRSVGEPAQKQPRTLDLACLESQFSNTNQGPR